MKISDMVKSRAKFLSNYTKFKIRIEIRVYRIFR